MRKDLAQLFNKFELLGRWEAGELLLRPTDAIRFADEIQILGGISIAGVDLWYKGPGGIREDPGCLDSSQIVDDDKWSIRAAKQFISEKLPPHILFVSFVLYGDDTD